jgi:hypothetical protein
MQKKRKEKKDFQPLVKSVLGQVSKRYSAILIRPDLRLRELGLNTAEIADLKIKLYRTITGKDDAEFNRFADAMSINPNSTVSQVVDRFAKTPVASRLVLMAGDDTTSVKGLDIPTVGTAVRVAIAQGAACPLAKIKPNLKLSHGSITFDSGSITDLKAALVQTFSGSSHPTRFKHFSTRLKIDPDSTVKQIIDRSVNALLRGDVDTDLKGAGGAEFPDDDITDIKGGSNKTVKRAKS